jgi:hypothetical protein
MATWDDFVPDTMAYVVDCPHFTVRDEARNAARSYFSDTRVWRSGVLTLATTVSSQADYTISNPTGLELAGLPAVWIDNVEVPEALPGDRYDVTPDQTGTLHRVLVADGSTIRLIPPDVTAGRIVTGVVAYVPTAASAGITDAMFDAHHRTIRELTLFYLKRMTGKPWADAAGAQRHFQQYMGDAGASSMQAGARRRTRLRVKKSI